MKRLLHKILSFLMAIVVLFSTMSFSIAKHYCGDSLVDIALFKEAKTCGMEKKSASDDEACAITKKNCCTDQQLLIQGQDNLKLDFSKLDLQEQTFIVSFVYSYINLFEDVVNTNIHFKDYSPPLIVKDIHVLDEVYLI